MPLTLAEPLTKSPQGFHVAVLVPTDDPSPLARIGGADVEPQADEDGNVTGAIVRLTFGPKPNGTTQADYVASIRKEVKALIEEALGSQSKTTVAAAGTEL